MPAEPDPQLMQRAIDLARSGVRDGAGGPFGAIVVRDGHVIAEGCNSVTSTNDPTAHAEMVAIRKACASEGTFSLAGCEIYTSCEPCPMCLAAILWSRMERVWYAGNRDDAARAGFDDARFYRLLEQGLSELPVEEFMRDEARVAFDEWLAKVDRTAY